MKYVGLDTETWLITPDNPIPKLVCMTISNGKVEKIYTDNSEEPLKYLLENDEITLVAHNAAYDFSVLSLEYPDLMEAINEKYKKGLILCSKLYESLLMLCYDGSSHGEKSLAFCVEKYLGKDISSTKGEDTWRLNYYRLDGVPLNEWPKEATKYALDDAKYHLEVFLEQRKVKEIDDLKVQSYCDWLCCVMTKIGGMEIDKEFLSERLNHFQGIIDIQTVILVTHGFKVPKTKKNPEILKKDTKAIKAIIEQEYDKAGFTIPTTPKGATKMDADTIIRIKGSHPGIDALINLGSSDTAVNTFLKPWSEHDVLHPSLDMIKSTGRMSCYKPNLQNVNRDGRIRGCLVPREGNYLCSIDYSQLELCTLAQVTYTLLKEHGVHSHMLEAINSGKDLHCVTGANILGVSYNDMLTGIKEGCEDSKWARQLAKAANFGLPGGLGVATFVDFARSNYGVKMTLQEASKVSQAFFESFPEIKEYFKMITKLKKSFEQGTFYVCNQLFTDRVRHVSMSGYCSACNTFFQGLASDGIKRSTINLMNACWFGDMQANPLMIIHDEFLFEIPYDVASKEANVLSKIMVDTMSDLLPDVTNIKADPCLMIRWEKSAEPVFDEDGELMPWVHDDE